MLFVFFLSYISCLLAKEAIAVVGESFVRGGNCSQSRWLWCMRMSVAVMVSCIRCRGYRHSSLVSSGSDQTSCFSLLKANLCS